MSLGLSIQATDFDEDFQDTLMQEVRLAILKTLQKHGGMPTEGITVTVDVIKGSN